MFSKTTELSIRRLKKIANRMGNIILMYTAFTLSAAVVKYLKYFDIYDALYKYAIHMITWSLYITATSIIAVMFAGFIFEDNELIDISLRNFIDWAIVCLCLSYISS